MMKSSLYTRTGDDGTTSLVGGARAKKNCKRLEAYGTIDELSSYLGAIASDIRCDQELQGQVREIQNELFNIGAYLATRPTAGEQTGCASLTAEKMNQLEGWIDALDEQTPKINAFILPGGSELAAKAHIARVTARRAERRIVDLSEEEYVDPQVIAYVNRLSDYLFIAARYINFMRGVNEIVWKKG
ncbi:MAG: cob(I)yrinic acid a,c-diamide adenosyltransferase [Muribaculaceae bacterium]|nr:cob(I)yrinic acid a,c-diamide adenosyltransferase [Muribaculaceae bacterium]